MFYQMLRSQAMPSSKVTIGHQPIPVALILDSTPGDDLIASTFALLNFLPIAIQMFAVLLTLGLHVLARFNGFLAWKAAFLNDTREALKSPDLLPPITSGRPALTMPRLYIYSLTDNLVHAGDVEVHAKEARELGFSVQEMILSKSPHVAHARTDPTRYWDEVNRLWAKALQSKAT
jgi:hypothetical protein